MLIQLSLASFLKVHLKLQQFYGTIPISICPNSPYKIVVVNIQSKLNYELFKLTVTSFYTFVLWVQLSTEGKDVAIVNTLESLLFAMAATGMCYAKWVVFFRRDKLVELYNMFLNFETYHLKSKQHIYLNHLHTCFFNYVFCLQMKTFQ